MIGLSEALKLKHDYYTETKLMSGQESDHAIAITLFYRGTSKSTWQMMLPEREIHHCW